ncbi:NlpC/P60 family protein [Virgibacillus sp. 179-BFC.A HS]|uniref:NlpC/P60 family protein n=1 Tax=Tigheibacillus jepli TaxID=3035914 RepID=A0ABU5CJP3_9BACI|nr:NlpC/P60 family protein [Virgibacillus sp. 179-BFC.A HS]MDY0405743.1 NlpC/P60 family protein [Virgibacillus sp. 179-BFC.A HS]
MNVTMENVMKMTVLYGYVLSQPFVFNADAVSAQANGVKQLASHKHSEMVRRLQMKNLSSNHIKAFNIVTKQHRKKFQKNNIASFSKDIEQQTLFSIIEAEKKRKLRNIERLANEMYPGMQGEKVKEVQNALQFLGYYNGSIDGVCGPLTTEALEIAGKENHIQLADVQTKNNAVQEPAVVQEPVSQNSNQDSVQSNSNEQKVTAEKKSIEQDQASNQDVEEKNVKSTGFNRNDITSLASSLVGTPYVWGGTSPSGFDCSGFVNYVYQVRGLTIPRTVSEVYNFATPVSAPSVGDLVFFETYKPGPSHMGIYLGNNQFIHAGESRGVEITDMNHPYWQSKYLGAKRVIDNH